MFKRKQIASIAASVLFVCLAGTALPSAAIDVTGGPPAEYTAFLKMKAEDIMHMMDKGNRGKVSKDEFLKFHEQMFKKMDKNGDGYLAPEEFYKQAN